jgi:two-component system OmpR family response regulator
VGASPLRLTRTEFDVLQALAAATGRGVEYSTISREVWGHAMVTPSAVRRHVVQLRRQLEAAGATVDIATVHGVGLRLVTRSGATVEELPRDRIDRPAQQPPVRIAS